MEPKQNNFENIKILNQHGSDALKAIFLLNGGASIAMLTFLGSIAVGADNGKIQASAIASVLLHFSLGAGLCVVSHSLNYLNLFFHHRNFPKVGDGLLAGTILVALLSLILFFVGIWQASDVFSD